MKTKENGENRYKMLNAWLRNCRGNLAFMKKEIKHTERDRERQRERDRERDRERQRERERERERERDRERDRERKENAWRKLSSF